MGADALGAHRISGLLGERGGPQPTTSFAAPSVTFIGLCIVLIMVLPSAGGTKRKAFHASVA
jgi:hypothetical protein